MKPAGTFIVIALSLCLLFQNNIQGQTTKEVDLELAEANLHTAPVMVDGNILFSIRGISSYTAEYRAASVSKRIKKAAANPSVPVDSVKVKVAKDHLMIYAGNEFIMNIYDDDAGIENINKEVLAMTFQMKIVEAIDSYRSGRSRTSLIKKSIYAFGATILLTVVLIVLLWLIRKTKIALQSRIKASIDSVESKSYKLIKSNNLWKTINVLFETTKIIVLIVVIFFYIEYILTLFPWTGNIAASIRGVILNPIISIGTGIINFLPDLVFLIVIYFVARYILKLIKLFFAGIGSGAMSIKGFYADWAMPTFRLLRILVITFAVILAYPHIPGSDSIAFKGVSVFIGALISFGSSSFIGNIISGYSLIYRRAFKKGDRIEVDNQIGIVEEQTMLATRLRSHKNEEIVIPNSVLSNNKIINYSTIAEGTGLILHTTVGIGYETSWRQVDAMLKEAAGRTEGLLKDPPPYVLKRSLGDFAVNYEINAYFRDVNRIFHYYNLLHQNILDVFNENGVQIMTPAYEGDPPTPKVVPKDQWDIPLKTNKI